jgi:hypothetical protein
MASARTVRARSATGFHGFRASAWRWDAATPVITSAIPEVPRHHAGAFMAEFLVFLQGNR